MIFLNYKHLDDFFQISGNIVKPTDGINSAEATLCVQTRKNFDVSQRIRVIARIVPKYVSRELVMTCDSGRRKFAPLIFKEDQLIASVQLRVIEAFGSDIAHDSLLLEKSFPGVPHQASMNFAYSGTRTLTYHEPIAGTKQPLWHIGGIWSGDNIESLFVCPIVRPERPTEVEVARVIRSQTANFDEFAVVPEDTQPWNLRECVESGGIKINTNGAMVKSSAVENISKENITIVFMEERDAK
ncbi:MAG: hypothetical protein LBF66_01870 [Holosporales bacterium]|jgi:hypothetical protein|nr:hypothetical protein [Holosporales bacterium]